MVKVLSIKLGFSQFLNVNEYSKLYSHCSVKILVHFLKSSFPMKKCKNNLLKKRKDCSPKSIATKTNTLEDTYNSQCAKSFVDKHKFILEDKDKFYFYECKYL